AISTPPYLYSIFVDSTKNKLWRVLFVVARHRIEKKSRCHFRHERIGHKHVRRRFFEYSKSN
uniref:RRM domain-containing protein n=1 Tax=Parascaris univalens TaxID=6257 RepID=A0A914ZMC4_PARUN